MDTEKRSTDQLDADIQQSKADILRFLQQASQSPDFRNSSHSKNKQSVDRAIEENLPDLSDSLPEASIPSGIPASRSTQFPSFDELQKNTDLKTPPPLPRMIVEIPAQPVSQPKPQESAISGNEIPLIDELADKNRQIKQLNGVLESLERQIDAEQLRAQNLSIELGEVQQQTQVANSERDRIQREMEEQKQQHQEQLQYERIELLEQHQQEKTSLENRIVTIEQLSDQLRKDNLSLSLDLSASRETIAETQQSLTQTSRERDATLTEKNALLAQVANLEDQARRQQIELEEIQQQVDQNKTAEIQIHAFEKEIASLQSRLEQEKQSAEQEGRQLRLRIAELEDQIAEQGQVTYGKTAELEQFISEQKTLLEKTEQQRRDLENRIASIQAENDRLCAAHEEAESLRGQLQQADQRLEVVNRQLERLKGDHQLVGEENNQLHQMLHLRNQELDKAATENKELKQEIAELKATQPIETVRQPLLVQEPSPEPQVQATAEETLDTEPSESKTGVPDFNLAEQIMAEQRRSVMAQRQSPASRPGVSRQGAISRVVEQFVGTSDKSEPQPKPSIEAPVFQPAAATLTSQTIPDASEQFFADIVRRDILSFLNKKQKAFEQPPWSWNKIN